MTAATEGILNSALALPAEERAALADRLLASLDAASQADIDKAWLNEIERRLQAHAEGQMPAIPADEVFRSLRKQRP